MEQLPMQTLPSTKPYLLRALYEWCCDSGLTPHIAVVVDAHTQVPREFVRDGQIVFNIGPDATNRLQIGNERIEFAARFSGVAREIIIPIGNVSAIYARENGAGMAFEVDVSAGAEEALEAGEAADEPEPPAPPTPPVGRPHLQRVK
jgi:stringent starvation protein B